LLKGTSCSCVSELRCCGQLGSQFGKIFLHFAINPLGLGRGDVSGIPKSARSCRAVSGAWVFVQSADLSVLRPGDSLPLGGGCGCPERRDGNEFTG